MPPAKITTRPCSMYAMALRWEKLSHNCGIAMAERTTASTPFLTRDVAQRQRIDDGGEHAHMVAGHPVTALGGDRHAAENVAAADHDATCTPMSMATLMSDRRSGQRRSTSIPKP